MIRNEADYVKKFRDELLFNVIPIRNDKKAIADPEYLKWFSEIYDEVITTKNIGVILGRTSNNLVCFDIDAHELYSHLEHWENKTLIVKSGKKGYHVYFRLMELPKFNNANLIKNGKTIEFFAQKRFMVLPPSFIEGESIQSYDLISDTKPKNISRIEFEGIFQKLQDEGFKIEYGGQTGNNSTIGKAKKTTKELENENWTVGCRYPNGRDLALRRFHEGWNYEQVKQEAIKKNDTLHESAPYSHVIDWVDAGYEIYQKNQEDNNGFFKPTEEFQKQKGKSKNFEADYFDFAEQVLNILPMRTLEDTDEILFYENGIYKENGKVEIKKTLLRLNRTLKINDLNEIISKIKQLTYTKRKVFDNDEFKICLRNCIVDIRTGKIEEHGPEKLFRIQLPVDYNPKARCPIFVKFVKTCLPLPDDYISVLEEAATPLIKNSPKLEAMYFHTGIGDNGKSTFFIILNQFYGSANYSTVSIHDLLLDRFARIRLENKMLNTFPDIESDAMENLGILKALISGDAIDAQKKHENSHTFENRAKLFFSANELPEIKEKTFANFKRIRLTKWSQKFLKPVLYKKELDDIEERLGDNFTESELKEELRLMGIHQMDRQFVESILQSEEEKSGILNMFLIIARHIIRRGGFTHEPDMDELKELWSENSTVTELFVKDCIRSNSEGWVKKSDIFLVYYNYAKKLGKPPLPDNVFHPEFQKLTPGIEDGKKRINRIETRIYRGISWNMDNSLVRKLTATGETGKSNYSSILNDSLDQYKDDSSNE